MTTVDKDFADKLIGFNGQWPSDGEGPPDPLVVAIIVYDNQWNGQGYKLVYKGRNPDRALQEMQANPYTKNPRMYWQRPAA